MMSWCACCMTHCGDRQLADEDLGRASYSARRLSTDAPCLPGLPCPPCSLVPGATVHDAFEECCSETPCVMTPETRMRSGAG